LNRELNRGFGLTKSFACSLGANACAFEMDEVHVNQSDEAEHATQIGHLEIERLAQYLRRGIRHSDLSPGGQALEPAALPLAAHSGEP
jgi:hypothetical protein